MAKDRPSRLRPLTLRFLTGLTHAHQKRSKFTEGDVNLDLFAWLMIKRGNNVAVGLATD